ncbi:MAG TPA: zinc-binding dehydrogenase [Roseiflexaceae bacterium]|nr:zinc-binding dehydrogenase [Roseiflexaceae bacterium]HMP41614.1 zinc-binding dehydrogenase [Roseiflexaceae bacterium]
MTAATMQALVYTAPREGTQLREIARPQPGPGEVVLEVAAVGVCGTDIHVWQHGMHGGGPVVLGHEFAGVVAAVGAGVSSVRPGDRVVSETASYVCGECIYCRSGQYNVCPRRRGFGFQADGAMANYVRTRPAILHRVPDDLPMAYAALTEPGCVAYNAIIEKSRPRPGDHAVVLGPGPIGLMSVAVLRLCGPTRISVVGLRRDGIRLELARRMGADEVVIADEEDAVARVLNSGDGYGADLVIDAVGVSATLRQSLDMVRPNGQITKIGWGPEPVGFSLDALIRKAATLQGSFSHTYGTWERVLTLLASRQIDVRPLVSPFALSDWYAGFSAMEDLEAAKSVLLPNGHALAELYSEVQKH